MIYDATITVSVTLSFDAIRLLQIGIVNLTAAVSTTRDNREMHSLLNLIRE